MTMMLGSNVKKMKSGLGSMYVKSYISHVVAWGLRVGLIAVNVYHLIPHIENTPHDWMAVVAWGSAVFFWLLFARSASNAD